MPISFTAVTENVDDSSDLTSRSHRCSRAPGDFSGRPPRSPWAAAVHTPRGYPAYADLYPGHTILGRPLGPRGRERGGGGLAVCRPTVGSALNAGRPRVRPWGGERVTGICLAALHWQSGRGCGVRRGRQDATVSRRDRHRFMTERHTAKQCKRSMVSQLVSTGGRGRRVLPGMGPPSRPGTIYRLRSRD